MVIGPPGVFTLNTKCHPKANGWVSEKVVMVNGQRTDYLRNSRFEARRAAKLLTAACGHDVAVSSMIVFVDLEKLTYNSRPSDVLITNRMSLVKFLKALPATLDATVVEAIFAHARLSTTWVQVKP